MAQEFRYDGQSVIVSGGGGALGRAYALMFGTRGANILVEDMNKEAADKVVAEVRARGGKAEACYLPVDDGKGIVQQCLDAFGSVHIVINNAGIIRDISFLKMSDELWDIIFKVHVRGAMEITRAAWPHMRSQKYGRIIMTSSAAGIYGNFGQTNYSAAKCALLGFGQTLAKEGAKYNIHTNILCPIAGSQMTQTVMTPDMLEMMKAEYVAPMVGYLCHDSCQENGQTYEVGGGWGARVRWERAVGYTLPGTEVGTVEDWAANWAKVSDFSSPSHPKGPGDAFAPVLARAKASKL